MPSHRTVRPQDVEWRPLGTHGLRCRTLAGNPQTGAMLNYLDIPKGWRGGGIAHYHAAFEEVLILSGAVTLGADRWFVEGDYFYRPRDVVHGHDERSPEGCIALVRSDGPLVLNLVHEPEHDDEYPIAHGDPRGHVLQLPVASVDWCTLPGFPAQWDIRPLSLDPETGARTLIARIPQGWSASAPLENRAAWAAYVLEGRVDLAETGLEAGDFAEGAAGTGLAGPFASPEGALVLFWFEALDG